jgi:hypothetical protein
MFLQHKRMDEKSKVIFHNGLGSCTFKLTNYSIKNNNITDVMTDYWGSYELSSQKSCIPSQKPKPIPSRAIAACLGISWLGCAESRSATAKAKTCLNIPSCF